MADGINKKKQEQKKNNGAYYKVQFGRTDDNKRKRVLRHLRNFPNDLQAAKYALDVLNRKAPEPNKAGLKVLKRAA